MRKLTLVLCTAAMLGWPCTAYAAWWNPMDWVGVGATAVVKTVDTTTEVVKGSGRVSISFTHRLLYAVDKLYHAGVKIFSLGEIDLDAQVD